MSYNNLDRAARDPYYRIAYEDQQRQQKQARDIAQMRSRSVSSSSGAASTGSSFTLPSSVSAGSSHSGRSYSGEPDAVAWLFRFMAPPALFLVVFIASRQAYPWFAQNIVTDIAYWLLLLVAALGFAIRYWRQVAVIALVTALYYVAR